jgi:hypothetical protein
VSTVPASLEAQAVARERETLCLRERLTGKSLEQIGKEQGWTNAHRIFDRAINRPENRLLANEVAVYLESLRLDSLNAAIWPRAMNGDPRAIEVALKLLERRSRMLGLDFQDKMSSRLVDLEAAKVEVISRAFLGALEDSRLPTGQAEAVSAAFFGRLRAIEGTVVRLDQEEDDHAVLAAEFEDLL